MTRIINAVDLSSEEDVEERILKKIVGASKIAPN